LKSREGEVAYRLETSAAEEEQEKVLATTLVKAIRELKVAREGQGPKCCGEIMGIRGGGN